MRLRRSSSWDTLIDIEGQPAEFFLASDASAVVEHTRDVVYLEDDDVAVMERGKLSIHRVKHTSVLERPVLVCERERDRASVGERVREGV